MTRASYLLAREKNVSVYAYLCVQIPTPTSRPCVDFFCPGEVVDIFSTLACCSGQSHWCVVRGRPLSSLYLILTRWGHLLLDSCDIGGELRLRLASEFDGRNDLITALADVLPPAGPGDQPGFLNHVAGELLRAYEQSCSDAAQKVGTLVATHTAGRPDEAKVLHDLVVAIERHFRGDGSSPRLAALFGNLCASFLTALQGRYAFRQCTTCNDVSGQLARELGAHETRLLPAVFAQAGVGVGIASISGRIVAVNAAFVAMFGYRSVEEFVANFNITDLTHPDDPPETWDLYAKMMRGELDRVRVEKPHLHRDGHTVWNSVNVSLIRDADGAPAFTLALLEDVTDRHQLQEKLRHQATHDPLTGLPNRSQFFDRLTELFRDPYRRIGICYVDLDWFKTVNDTLGHDVGDKLLVEVAKRLQSCVHSPEQLVARLGGDEFIFLMPCPNGSGEVTGMADAVLRALESPIDINGIPLTVSASVGIVEELTANTCAGELMKGADASLARAKEAGRNQRAIYDPDLLSRMSSPAKLPAINSGPRRRPMVALRKSSPARTDPRSATPTLTSGE